MSFNQEEDGSPLVNVGGEAGLIIVDLDDLDNGYHLYEMVFNPTTEKAELFVDGTLRASDIELFEPGPPVGIDFGSTWRAGTGHANYSLIKFEVIPEPQALILVLLACFGLLAARRVQQRAAYT